ncbi:hypothetical protein Glove_120g236 [Diversispora epigaea]|uniref:Uncharacterized protein n=1 Tax=Diversispora epigaea TaxID=1348612 RepID=A0A397IZK9_9GLOM|nr:hypothetical protein Glove_120g236 [Diversispora epigaea]
MFESIIDDYLKATVFKNWSVINMLEYVESKSEISEDMIESLKEEIGSILQNDVKHFINRLNLKKNKREFRTTICRNVMSTSTLQALEEYRLTRQEIENVRNAKGSAGDESNQSTEENIQKMSTLNSTTITYVTTNNLMIKNLLRLSSGENLNRSIKKLCNVCHQMALESHVLTRTFQKKLLRNLVDSNVLNIINDSGLVLKNLKTLVELRLKLAQIVNSEDAILTSLILDFFHKNFRQEINHLSIPLRERDYISRILLSLMTDLLEEFDSTFEIYGIEKTSESTNARKRRKIHPEYTKFENDST